MTTLSLAYVVASKLPSSSQTWERASRKVGR